MGLELVVLHHILCCSLLASLGDTMVYALCYSCGDSLVWLVTQLVHTALTAAAGGQKLTLSSLTSAHHPHVTLLRALPQHSHQLAAETERLLLADPSPQ